MFVFKDKNPCKGLINGSSLPLAIESLFLSNPTQIIKLKKYETCWMLAVDCWPSIWVLTVCCCCCWLEGISGLNCCCPIKTCCWLCCCCCCVPVDRLIITTLGDWLTFALDAMMGVLSCCCCCCWTMLAWILVADLRKKQKKMIKMFFFQIMT